MSGVTSPGVALLVGAPSTPGLELVGWLVGWSLELCCFIITNRKNPPKKSTIIAIELMLTLFYLRQWSGQKRFLFISWQKNPNNPNASSFMSHTMETSTTRALVIGVPLYPTGYVVQKILCTMLYIQAGIKTPTLNPKG